MPGWRVLDRVEAAKGTAVNEDLVGVAGDLAWVLDGATPLTPERLTDAQSDARWLVELADGRLREAGTSGDRRPLGAIVADIARDAREAARRWPSTRRVPPSAAVGVLRRTATSVEYLVLADVVVAAGGSKPIVISDHAVDRANDGAIRTFESELRRTGSHAKALEAALPKLIDVRISRMNRPGGYWVLADAPEAAGHALVGEFECDDRDILLCTDGFARVVDLFGVYKGWDDLVSAPAGLEAALDALRLCERSDPECLRFPRWSVSDDAAAMLVAAA